MLMMVRSLLLATFVVLGSILVAAAQPPPANHMPMPPTASTNLPKLKFATPVYDFGRLRSGEVLKYSYVFTNTGPEMIEITHVQPSCGCTAAGEWTRKVEPGQTGSIPIQFNSANFNGPVFKTVTVMSTDKGQSTSVLQLKGTVWRPVDVSPQFAVLNIPPDVPSATASVRIVNNMEEPLVLSPPESNNRVFTAELKTNVPGKEFQVVVTGTRPPTTTGNIQGLVTLKSSSTNMPIVTVNVWANIQPHVLVMPPQLTLPPPPLAASISPRVTIQNNTTNTLSVSDPVLSLDGVKVELTEPQPGKQFLATLTFPQGFEIPAGQQPALTLKCSNTNLPLITVPIRQLPRQVLSPTPVSQPAGRPMVQGPGPKPPQPAQQ